MQMSMAAKAAWPLLWTECDDHGVFEWKPVVLKARIFPADNVDFAAVLEEYASLGCIRMAEVDGKPIGFVRNFCRYQKPKSPSYRFSLPPDQEKFVGLNGRHSGSANPILPRPLPSAPEKDAQREEGRGKREEDSPSDKSSGEVARARTPAPRPGNDHSPGADIVHFGKPNGVQPKKAKRIEAPWPDDLVLGEAERAYAEERGFRGEGATRLWEAFEANAKAKALRYADWRQAWRTWVIKQIEFDARAGRPAYASGSHRPRGRPPDV